MSNLIVLFSSVIISYLIFFLEKENLLTKIIQASNFNDILGNVKEEKRYDLINSSNTDVSVTKKTNQGFKFDSRIELNKKTEIVNTKISTMRKDLNSNLKHLEFILTIENQLANLASKDKYTVEKLQKYVEIKMEVQLKIIQLSQSISNYPLTKINLC